MSDYLGRQLFSGECVHHINGDRKDNRLENLELMLHSEHSRCHSSQQNHACSKKYENHNKAKLKNSDIPQIRYLLAIGMHEKQIGNLYSVHWKTVSDIKNNKTWISII